MRRIADLQFQIPDAVPLTFVASVRNPVQTPLHPTGLAGKPRRRRSSALPGTRGEISDRKFQISDGSLPRPRAECTAEIGWDAEKQALLRPLRFPPLRCSLLRQRARVPTLPFNPQAFIAPQRSGMTQRKKPPQTSAVHLSAVCHRPLSVRLPSKHGAGAAAVSESI